MKKQIGRSVLNAFRGVVIAALAVFGCLGHAAAQTPVNVVANGGFGVPAISGSFTTFNVGTGPTSWLVSGASMNGYRST